MKKIIMKITQQKSNKNHYTYKFSEWSITKTNIWFMIEMCVQNKAYKNHKKIMVIIEGKYKSKCLVVKNITYV